MKRFFVVLFMLITVSAYGKDLTDTMVTKPALTLGSDDTFEIFISYSSAGTGRQLRRLTNSSILKLGGVDTTAPDGERMIECSNSGAMNITGLTDANAGRFCFDKSLGKFRYWTGTNVVDMGGGASTIVQLSDWPTAVSATEVGYLDGVTSGIQAQFISLSTQVADLKATMEAAGLDSTPTQESINFIDQTGVALSTLITSQPITIAGINTTTAINVSGGSYSIDGGSFTSASGTVTNGQSVRAQHTSAATNSTAINTTITVGGVSDIFTSTTLAAQSCSEVFASATPATDSVGIKTDANRVYQGMIITGSTTSPVCSITVRVHGMAGNRTTYNYRAYLYSRNGTALNLETGLKATSNPVVGSTMTTGNEVTFTFPTPIVPATGDVFVFSHDQAVSSANYILLSRGTADTDSGFAQQASYFVDGTLYTTAASYELYYKLTR